MSPSCRANGVVQRRFRPSHTSSQAQVPCGKSRIGMASGAGIANLDLAGVVLSGLGGIFVVWESVLAPDDIHDPRQRAWGTINTGPRLLLHIASCTMSWQMSGWEAGQPVSPGLPTPEGLRTKAPNALPWNGRQGRRGRAAAATNAILSFRATIRSRHASAVTRPLSCYATYSADCLPRRDGGTAFLGEDW